MNNNNNNNESKAMVEVRENREHRRTCPIFDTPFREIVFKMWCEGNTLAQITDKFKGTEKEFSFQQLVNVKRDDRWDERRDLIDDAVRKDTDEQIKKANTQKVEALNLLVDAVFNVIKMQIEEFVQDPKTALAAVNPRNRPLWLVNRIDDLERLFKLHEFIVNKRSDKNVTDNSSVNLQQLNVSAKDLDLLPEDMQSKLLRILSSKDDFKEDMASVLPSSNTNNYITEIQTEFDNIDNDESE